MNDVAQSGASAPAVLERPNRRAPLARCGWTAVALIVAAVALWISATDVSSSPLEVVLDAVCGLTLIATGAWALGARRDRRLGYVLLLAGSTWFVKDFVVVDHGPIGVIGDLLWASSLVPVAYLALAFPGSVLRDRASRLAMVLVVFGALVLAPIKRFAGSEPLRETVVTAMTIVGVLGGALVLGLLVRRYIRASHPLRRSIGPFMWCALALAVLAIVDLVISDSSRGLIAAEYVLVAALALGCWRGLLRVRARRAAAASMAVELATLRPGESAREVLVRALGDPDIELVLFNGGGPVAVQAAPRQVATPLVAHGRTFGVLVHDPALEDAAELVPAAANALALRLDHERLTSAQAKLADELQDSLARIVAASAATRRGVQRDPDDGAPERLGVVGLKLAMIRAHLEQNPATVAASSDQLREEVNSALAELHELARGIFASVDAPADPADAQPAATLAVRRREPPRATREEPAPPLSDLQEI